MKISIKLLSVRYWKVYSVEEGKGACGNGLLEEANHMIETYYTVGA